jgi:hypothetical protein
MTSVRKNSALGGSRLDTSGSASVTSDVRASIWQHPFVDVFKHFKLQPTADWKSVKKHGDVQEEFVSAFHLDLIIIPALFRPKKLDGKLLRFKEVFPLIILCKSPTLQHLLKT